MIDTVPVPPEDPDALFSPLSTLVVVSPPHADAVGADLASLPGPGVHGLVV